MKKTALSLVAAAALGLSSVAVQAAQVFQVNEGSVAGANANVLSADKLNGAYSERLTINADLSFDTQAFGSFTAYRLGANGVDAQLGNQTNNEGISGANLYQMYFTFSSSGSFNPGNGSFTGSSGSFNLYLDPTRDTTPGLGTTGTDPITISDANADDYLIATATNLTYAFGNPSDIAGAFDLFWDDFQRTLAGEAYFTLPTDFYLRVNVDGDFDEFTPALANYIPGTTQDFFVRGDVSAVFDVPEPGSLALVGFALAGLGLSARRRKS